MTQQQESVITDEMRARIGVESEPAAHEVDNTGCRQFARAVGYTDAIYFDEAAAKAKGHRAIVAPYGFLGHPVVVPGQQARVPEATEQDDPAQRMSPRHASLALQSMSQLAPSRRTATPFSSASRLQSHSMQLISTARTRTPWRRTSCTSCEAE